MKSDLEMNAVSEWLPDCPEKYRLGMNGTKWRIFCCAIHFFSEDDYSSISMRSIADMVGIKASSIYNHFSSKEAILLEAYQYVANYATQFLPDVEYFIEKIEQEHPYSVFEQMSFYYPRGLKEMMSKILVLCSKLMRTESIADRIVSETLIEVPQRYMKVVLNEMIKRDKIEQLDVEAFLELYANNIFASTTRGYSSHPIDEGMWERSFGILFSIIKPVTRMEY